MRQTNKYLHRYQKEEELTFTFEDGKEITVIKFNDFDDSTEKDDNGFNFKTKRKDREVYNSLTDEQQDQLKERLGDDFENSAKAWLVKLCERLEELDLNYYSDNFYAEFDDWFKSYFG